MNGQCDVCGRFAGAAGTESYDAWQPDPWNGPRTTFRCPTCQRTHEATLSKEPTNP